MHACTQLTPFKLMADHGFLWTDEFEVCVKLGQTIEYIYVELAHFCNNFITDLILRCSILSVLTFPEVRSISMNS